MTPSKRICHTSGVSATPLTTMPRSPMDEQDDWNKAIKLNYNFLENKINMLTLIEEDLRLKLELQTVKHQFSGLLDNFRSFDRILQAPHLISQGQDTRGTNQRVDDARCRVRALYAAKRSRLMKQRQEAEGGEVTDNRAHCWRTPQRTPRRHAPYQHTPRRSHYDTSVWSEDSAMPEHSRARNHRHSRHRHPTRHAHKPRARHQPHSSPNTVDINDISCISGQRHIREHTSSADLSGDVLHSTLNYPLHSTLNYPLHSTVMGEVGQEEDSLGSPVSHNSSSSSSTSDRTGGGRSGFAGKRRLFREDVQAEADLADYVIDEYGVDGCVDHTDPNVDGLHDFEVDVDVTIPASPPASVGGGGQLVPDDRFANEHRCLKRQTAQARLDADVAYYRRQVFVGDTDVSCLADDVTFSASRVADVDGLSRSPLTLAPAAPSSSSQVICQSMPDLTFTSTPAYHAPAFPVRSNTSANIYANRDSNNRSSSTNASSLPQKQVPQNSPNSDQSNGSCPAQKSRSSSRRSVSEMTDGVSTTRSRTSRRSSVCKSSLDQQLGSAGLAHTSPYKLQKSTSVRLHDRAMRKSLKRKMRRFNEDIHLSAEHSHAYDVLVYL